MKTYLMLVSIFIILSVSCALIKEQAIGAQPVEQEPAVVAQTKARRLGFAPDFKLEDLNQRTFTLSSYKDRQPVLLFFWTTWCPYCRSELKLLNDLYPQLLKEGWELFAINVAESVYRVENFVRNYALGFKVLLDRYGSVMDSYGLFGVPTYVLVDEDGYIVFTDYYFPQTRYKELLSK